MPRFIAVHTLPMGAEEFMEFSKQSSEQLSQLPPSVAFNFTYCGFDDHKFFCDWEAPSKEPLEQIFKTMEMPYDAIHPVRLFNVAKMELEA